MADKTITDLGSIPSAILGTDVFPLDRSGTTYKATAADIAEYAGGSGLGVLVRARNGIPSASISAGFFTSLPFATVDLNVGTCWGSSTFTAPADGLYRIELGDALAQGDWTTGDEFKFSIWINGSFAHWLSYFTAFADVTAYIGHGGSVVVELEADDTLVINLQNTSADSRTLYIAVLAISRLT